MEDIIEVFLTVDSNHGYGCGLGCGYGYGHGDSRNGTYDEDDGFGFSGGCGYGSGYGHETSESGYGHGESPEYCDKYDFSYNGQKIYMVDDIATIIDSVHTNYAIGKIVKRDLTTEDCYIAKVGNYFAHGKTLKEAVSDATAKYRHNQPLDERLEAFLVAYPSIESVAQNADLYRWHNILTGSCAFGRDEFAKEHGLDKTKGSMTIREFINLVINSYGSDIIKTLKSKYEKCVNNRT